MKFSKVLTAGALVAALATVASCGNKTETTKTGGGTTTTTDDFTYTKAQGNGSDVDLSVHYVNSSYHFTPSYQGDSTVTGIGGESLVKGTVLPAWQAIGSNLNYNIKDATKADKATLKDEMKTYVDAKSMGTVDLAMISNDEQSLAAINGGLFKSIDELLDAGKLPNFAHWLENNGGRTGSLWNSMKAADGKVYYLPYFDGQDNLEKMWLMNQDYIERLLDGDLPTGLGTTAAATSSFQAQVPSMTNEKVKVSKNGVLSEVTVNYTQSVIAKQNALTSKTGKSYVETLRNHIDEVYGKYIGANKLYSSRSEIFTSEAACYNADDLIALMRCMVNNASFLTNGSYDTVYAFAPRTGEGNRVKQMVEFTNIWAAQGVSAESNYFYFDGTGTLQDARTKSYMYDNLDKMHELYNEGFFPGNFYTGNGAVKTEWRSAYMKTGQLFSLYDYNATSTAFNQDVLGEATSKSNLIPMLPPVAKWNAGNNSGENNYFHYSEDNRALKTGGWAVSKEGNIDGACAVADYLWMPEGADIQDYGPNTTAYRAAVTAYDADGHRVANEGVGTIDCKGQQVVKFADTVINAKIGSDSFKGGWNNFARKYIGSTQGIGHKRSDGVDYQTTFSALAQAGLGKMNDALAAGSMRQALAAGDGIFHSVPTSYALTSTNQTNIDNCTENTVLKNLWQADSSVNGKEVFAYWICGGSSDTNVVATIGSVSAIKNSFTTVDSVFLYAYRMAYLSTN